MNNIPFRSIQTGAMLFLVLFASSSCSYAAGVVNETSRSTNSVSTASFPRGTWVWNKNSWLTPAARDELFTFLKQHGISMILVQIHTDYSGAAPKLNDREQLSELLRRAAQEGVTVHALDGGPDYIYPPWPEKLTRQIAAIAEFNSKQPANARFAGVHYDIEPYLLPDWKKDWDTRLQCCRTYLAALQTLATAARSHELQFSVDIPSWFDTGDKLQPFEVNGHIGTLLDHVAQIVDWFGIMAYRNHATGPDGILSISAGEVDVMDKLGKKVWIGVETGDAGKGSPPKVTFLNRPTTEFDQALQEVNNALVPRKSYGGILIHSYERYREYLSKPQP